MSMAGINKKLCLLFLLSSLASAIKELPKAKNYEVFYPIRLHPLRKRETKVPEPKVSMSMIVLFHVHEFYVYACLHVYTCEVIGYSYNAMISTLIVQTESHNGLEHTHSQLAWPVISDCSIL